MSEAKCSTGALTRRGFLKSAGATAGALGLASAVGMTATGDWLTPAAANAEPEERTALICHQFHCLSGCGLKCTARDGRLVLIEPQEFEDGTCGKICLRGLSEIQHVYSPDRIQTPLKRVGERGEGKFEAISWDEAIKTIADEIKNARTNYGPESVMVKKSVEAIQAHNGLNFLASLLGADTGGLNGLDRGQANGTDPSGLTTAGKPSSHMRDWKNAETVVCLSINFMESSIVYSSLFFEAKRSGAKIVVIDPRFSPTAQKADIWLPVKPGTDAALFLASINQVLANEWHDEEFVRAHTSFPFLIDEASGAPLGEMRTIEDPEEGPQEILAPYIWDQITGSLKLYDDPAAVAALEGSFSVNGAKARPQFALLKERMVDYTPEWAAGVTGLSEDEIRAFADRFANMGPVVVNYGFGGADKYSNSDILGHAVAVLVALTGNSGKLGTGVGSYSNGGSVAGPMGLQKWALPQEFTPGPGSIPMYEMPYKENPIRVVLSFGDALSLGTADANATYDWLKGLDFFAICDIYHSSAVDYADIVLPACTKFESPEEVSDVRFSMSAPYLYLNQKVIEPLFEAKHDLEVERLIAAEFGYGQYLPQSLEELARFTLSEPGPNIADVTYEGIKESGSFRFANADMVITSPATFPDQTYPTASGRIELYYPQLLEFGQAFPSYEAPSEAYDENPVKGDYPLVFTQGKTRYRIHAYFSSAGWFSGYYGPSVEINPADAADRGIENGDKVRVFNGRGEFVCRAVVNASIQPGSLFMAETTYRKYYEEGLMQNVTNPFCEPRGAALKFGPQINFNDTLVDIVKEQG